MFAGSAEIIHDDPRFRRNMQDAPAMCHSLRHPAIPTVFPLDIIEPGQGELLRRLSGEFGFPVKGPTLFGLIPAVDADGVMRPRGTEVAAPLRSAVVNERSRIYEEFPAPAEQSDRQGIRVSVGAGEDAEPAAVEDQMTV